MKNILHQFLALSIVGIMFFSILFNNIYGESSEVSVIVKVVDVEKFKGQTWNINAQLRDKTNDSELAKDKTTDRKSVV